MISDVINLLFLGVIDSFSFQYVNAFLGAKPYAKYLSHSGNTLLETSRIIQKRFGTFIYRACNLCKIIIVTRYQICKQYNYGYLKYIVIKTSFNLFEIIKSFINNDFFTNMF